jgi:hypothetical protein
VCCECNQKVIQLYCGMLNKAVRFLLVTRIFYFNFISRSVSQFMLLLLLSNRYFTLEKFSNCFVLFFLFLCAFRFFPVFLHSLPSGALNWNGSKGIYFYCKFTIFSLCVLNVCMNKIILYIKKCDTYFWLYASMSLCCQVFVDVKSYSIRLLFLTAAL